MENYKFTQYEGDEMAALFEKIDELDAATPSKSGLMSSTDKSKLDDIEANAQENVLEGVQMAGTDLSISEKKVNIPVDNAPTEGSSALVRSGGVAAALAAINQFRYQVVETLPTASADTMRIIYLVPSENPETENAKDEFITIDNGESADPRYTWEQIGSTAIDISGKADKDLDAVENNLAKFDANGNPVDSGISAEKIDEIEGKITALGTSAGIAEGIADTVSAGTAQEFTFRKSGGDGVNYMKRIKGKTIAWNQLVEVTSGSNTNIDSRGNENSPVIAMSNGNVLFSQIVITPQRITAIIDIPAGIANFAVRRNGQNLDYYLVPFEANLQTKIAGHKIYFTANIKAVDYATLGGYQWENVGITDLTIFFNGNIPEGYTVADFERDFPELNGGYNPGTLKSNDAEAVETTGANQWDEEGEEGILDNNGVPQPQTNRWRAKNMLPVFPNTVYYIKSAYSLYVYEYDAAGNMVNYAGALSNASFTTTAQTSFIRFHAATQGGAQYDASNAPICINISKAAINGQYFPYWKRTLQLGLTTKEDMDGNVPFADGMKGAGTAADWADKVGGEVVMGEVDLGSLGWVKVNTANSYRFEAALNNVKRAAASNILGNAICDKYATIKADDTWTGAATGIAISNSEDKVLVYDTSYPDASAFKTAMDGVKLIFEKATPVPFTWAEPLPNAILVDSAGTEQAVFPVHEDGTPSAPFKSDSNYSISIKNLLAKLSE